MTGPEGLEPVDALYDTVYDLLPGIIKGNVSAEDVAGDAQYRLGRFGTDEALIDMAQDEIDRIRSGDLSGVFGDDEGNDS